LLLPAAESLPRRFCDMEAAALRPRPRPWNNSPPSDGGRDWRRARTEGAAAEEDSAAEAAPDEADESE
jgi:hypothetical protein